MDPTAETRATAHPVLIEIAAVAELAGLPHEFRPNPDGSSFLLVSGVFERQGLAVFSVDGAYLRAELPSIGVDGPSAEPRSNRLGRGGLCELVALVDFRHRGLARLGVDTDDELRAIVALPLPLGVPAAEAMAFALEELRAVMAAFVALRPPIMGVPFAPHPSGRLLN